ncbi:ABC transporter ATP-binding protein [Oribacterium sinus]|jgi:ABC superfamily ATP binding cassette transporter, ABC protein|uniref:ABC transporter, ATP-binding protein n=1 Tax=Oribacterium sinus F0268 TaxID=585501 RepID=C2KXR8_9FIRM|nr:ABC transporter ATP-binding protein [Oribacterium sinus]EEJ51463.1 ABC transporter, ATP-binding protein [Oribacterium sinus F0268]
MEEAEKIISVDQVSKVYRLYDKPIDRLLESISLRKKSYHKDFYALRDISFSVGRGEAVGIIGTNGSGKSTMLKIITGVLSATTGKVESRGSICALLELGAGFNQDYTGIENIYMNGTMMGFSKAEMDEKLPAILEFADIGDFVYQPVKSYSSGMFVRLAFALYISIDPEVLIVDEALSVGDVFFQAKCYHRMDELKRKGTTILMVTHDLGSVMKYCDRVVLFHKGEKVGEGLPGQMVDKYKKILAGKDPHAEQFMEEQNFLGNVDGEATGTVNASGTTGQDASTGNAGTTGAEDKAGTTGAGTAETTEKNADTGIASGTAEPASPEAGQHSLKPTGFMKDHLTLNPSSQQYGNGKAEILDFGVLDKDGRPSNVLLKGEEFSIKERIVFHDDIAAPIFTFTIKDKRGMDLSGTNTLFEGKEIPAVKKGDEYYCTFTQRMNLQGGEYLLSISCTGFEEGEHTVYDRKYDITSITVLSNKNTVGIYDMESEVTLERHEA